MRAYKVTVSALGYETTETTVQSCCKAHVKIGAAKIAWCEHNDVDRSTLGLASIHIEFLAGNRLDLNGCEKSL